MPRPDAPASRPRAKRQKARKPDAVATRENILAVAREEFAEHGLAGARVDAIAARTSTAKRMIYYYFGSKEGLYLAALEAAYANIRHSEVELKVDQLSPVDAIVRLIEFTFDYDEAHPEFIRLVMAENMNHGEYVARSDTIRQRNRGVIAMLRQILERGQREGVFREGIDPVDIHMLISAFCFFRVSNRYTFGALFGRDLSEPSVRAAHKKMLADAVLTLLAAEAQKAGSKAA